MAQKARKVEEGPAGGVIGEDELAQALSKYENEFSAIREEFEEVVQQEVAETLTIHQKYAKARLPIYKKRTDLMRKIPGIWYHVLVNHRMVADLLEENDAAILQHLEDLQVEESEDLRSGFKVELHFGANPIIKNKTLSITVTIKGGEDLPEGEETVEPDVVECTPIEWHEGKDFTKGKGKKRAAQAGGLIVAFVSKDLNTLRNFAETVHSSVWPHPFGEDEDEDEEGFEMGEDDDDDEEEEEDGGNGADE